MTPSLRFGALAAVLLMVMSGTAGAQSHHPEGSDAHLAQQLQNPIAALINVPFQNNFDFDGGPSGDGFNYTVNFQPIVPIRLTDDWTLVTRTIVPFSHTERYFPDHEHGLGDITQSFFLSPRVSAPGLTVGFGAAFLYPTATNDQLGSRQWGAGPTAIAVQQKGAWTFGLLANHLWNISDSGSRGTRERLNQTLAQPFISYTFGGGFSLIATSESTYDWTARQWTVPIGGGFTQLVKIGELPVNLGLQARYYPEAPSTYAEWGVRFVATFVFR
ncbi:hypothetical protein HMPREF9946_00899 [Acetobacteraceae bacterium AT-5844]|nr:hypothetical protein HMPREF9946_00899 [Acetobacteraceae bacterium AT-5844]